MIPIVSAVLSQLRDTAVNQSSSLKGKTIQNLGAIVERPPSEIDRVPDGPKVWIGWDILVIFTFTFIVSILIALNFVHTSAVATMVMKENDS